MAGKVGKSRKTPEARQYARNDTMIQIRVPARAIDAINRTVAELRMKKMEVFGHIVRFVSREIDGDLQSTILNHVDDRARALLLDLDAPEPSRTGPPMLRPYNVRVPLDAVEELMAISKRRGMAARSLLSQLVMWFATVRSFNCRSYFLGQLSDEAVMKLKKHAGDNDRESWALVDQCVRLHRRRDDRPVSEADRLQMRAAVRRAAKRAPQSERTGARSGKIDKAG